MYFKKTIKNSLFLATTYLLIIPTSQADTVTGSFDVKIKITSVCSVTAASTAQDINFPNTVAGATVSASQGSAAPITVACSKSTPYIINLTPSNNNTAGAGEMSGPGTDKIAYQLNQTSTGTVWGSTGVIGTPGNGVSGTGTGVTDSADHTVYAAITGSTDVDIGDYSDTVTVSVLY